MASHPRKRSPKARKELKDPTLQVAEPNGVTPESAPPERARKARDETPAQEENSIRARRARIRATPREEGKPKPTEVPRTAPAPDSRAVPEHMSARYIKVGQQVPLSERRSRVLGPRPGIIDSIGEYRGHPRSHCHCQGAGLERRSLLRGTERFRKEAWQQAKLAGLAVRGYRPSELERAQLARLHRPRARCRPRCAID